MAIDVYEISFFIFFALTILSSALVFIRKKLLNAIIALTMAFASSSFLFLTLNQPFIALLQLLVFVGGLSTYLMVSLANEEKGRRYFRPAFFVPIAAVLSICFYYFAQLSITAATVTGGSIESVFAAALEQYYLLLFGIVALLFSVAMGSALFMKKFVRMVT